MICKRSDYREKIDTELEIVAARFATFKAEAKQLTSADRFGYAGHLERIEKNIETTKAKLREPGFRSFVNDSTYNLLKCRYEYFYDELNYDEIENRSSDGNHVAAPGVGFVY